MSEQTTTHSFLVRLPFYILARLIVDTDPLYMGWKHTRVRGELYNSFVDKFIRHTSSLFPDALIHFEE